MTVATNTLLTNNVITNEALVVLRNSFTLVPRALRTVDDLFGKVGYKNGSTIQVRIPVRYESATGSAINLNNSIETSTSITLIQRNIGMNFTTKDLTLSIDLFRERFIEPAIAQLASDVDSDGYAAFQATNLATPGAYSSGSPAQWVGNGTDVGTLRPFLDAKARLEEQAAPKGDRYAALTPGAEAALVDTLKSLFQSATEIAEQYKRGLMGLAAGLEFVESNTYPTFVSGSRSVTGSTFTSIDGTGANVTMSMTTGQTVAVNDQFTIAGVYSINPLTRRSTGKLQVFTVTGAATAASSAVTLNVYPAMSVTAPDETVSAMPVSSAAITFMGPASTSCDVNLVWQKNAVLVAFCDLDDDLPGAEAYVARDPETGIALRFVRQYLSTPDVVQNRLDILYGWKWVRPTLSCRVQG